MASAQPQKASQPWPLWRTASCAALLVVAVETLLLFTGASGVRHGVLIDPDCFMHLERAYRLMAGGWQSGGFDPRINAPFGYAIHWTILFDALLAAGAAPLAWLGMDLHHALYLWGSLISPLLLMLALAVFAWGVRPWVQGPSFLWLTLLLFTQPQLSGAFLVGRADHHSLILGLMLAQLAWLYAAMAGRLGEGRVGVAAAFAAGVGAGVQLCTTVEGLLTLLLVSMVLAIAWAWWQRAGVKLLFAYWAGCLAMTLAWLMLTRREMFFQPAYDRVSIVHAVVLGVGALAIALVMLLARAMPRLAALGLAGAMAAAAIGALYPDFFLGPWPASRSRDQGLASRDHRIAATVAGQHFSCRAIPGRLRRELDRAAFDSGQAPARPTRRAGGDADRLVRLLPVRRPVAGADALVGRNAGRDAGALDAHHPAHHEKLHHSQAAQRPDAASQRLPDGGPAAAAYATGLCRHSFGPGADGHRRLQLGRCGTRAGRNSKTSTAS